MEEIFQQLDHWDLRHLDPETHRQDWTDLMQVLGNDEQVVSLGMPYLTESAFQIFLDMYQQNVFVKEVVFNRDQFSGRARGVFLDRKNEVANTIEALTNLLLNKYRWVILNDQEQVSLRWLWICRIENVLANHLDQFFSLNERPWPTSLVLLNNLVKDSSFEAFKKSFQNILSHAPQLLLLQSQKTRSLHPLYDANSLALIPKMLSPEHQHKILAATQYREASLDKTTPDHLSIDILSSHAEEELAGEEPGRGYWCGIL